eukprot:15106975-Alexandrium_andersonii.AAC.1
MISLILSRVGSPGVSCAGPKCPGATLTTPEPVAEKFSGKRSSKFMRAFISQRMHRPVSFCCAS